MPVTMQQMECTQLCSCLFLWQIQSSEMVWLVCAYVLDGICLTCDTELHFEFGVMQILSHIMWHTSDAACPLVFGHSVHLKMLVWNPVQVSFVIHTAKH